MILQSFPVPHSMPISEFSIANSINRFEVAAIFNNEKHQTLYEHMPAMSQFGEQLQKLEPVIRDFIDCMEPGTPQVEIESCRRTNSCLVLIRLKKTCLKTMLCSRLDLTFHLKMMLDICNGF